MEEKVVETDEERADRHERERKEANERHERERKESSDAAERERTEERERYRSRDEESNSSTT